MTKSIIAKKRKARFQASINQTSKTQSNKFTPAANESIQTLLEFVKKETGKKTFWAGQFENLANYKFHEKTTAKEIFDQTNGTVDGFTCAIGTGGTITGISVGLKNLNKNIYG